MRIAVVDGQGGGIGRAVVERLRKALPEDTEIVALGTNATATAVMLRAGANEGASGDGAIIYGAKRADVLVGVVSILLADSFLGELGAEAAAAIARSDAVKILIPLNRQQVWVAGVEEKPLPHYIEDVVALARRALRIT
ncbi:MAG: DUF3842 family protein [Clostridiales bacterium]|jgi:hypothetical protein|nr:DUF3842 family protein [Clostridiales bacterium]